MAKRKGRALLTAAAGLAAASFGLSSCGAKTYCSWGVGQDEPVDAGDDNQRECAACDAGPDGGADAGLPDAGDGG